MMIVAVMVLMDWPFDQTTAMVDAIALGIVVDDTLHFMTQFRRFFLAYNNVEEALKETFYTTGRALTITTVLLVSVFAGKYGARAVKCENVQLFVDVDYDVGIAC